MKDEINVLLEVTKALRKKYNRSFPLDGRLVGDIGEALVKRDFQIELYPENTDRYDGFEIKTNRNIQIKSSMKYNFSFPFDFCPDYYIAVHINPDATLEVVYNGDGRLIKDYIRQQKLKGYKQTYFTLTAGTLRTLNDSVLLKNKIKTRE